MNSTTVANRLKKYAHAPWEPAWPAAAEAPTSETGPSADRGALENIVVTRSRTPCGPNTRASPPDGLHGRIPDLSARVREGDERWLFHARQLDPDARRRPWSGSGSS